VRELARDKKKRDGVALKKTTTKGGMEERTEGSNFSTSVVSNIGEGLSSAAVVRVAQSTLEKTAYAYRKAQAFLFNKRRADRSFVIYDTLTQWSALLE
jgi:hypothetical protein